MKRVQSCVPRGSSRSRYSAPRIANRYDFGLRASVEKTGRLVVVEEQVHAAGWGATLISRLTLAGVQLEVPPRVVGLPDDLLLPYSPPLEDALIPGADAVVEAVHAQRG